jgi:hypothetical protein
MTLSDSTLLWFKLINPISYKISPTEDYTGPYNFNFSPSTNLAVGDLITVRWAR